MENKNDDINILFKLAKKHGSEFGIPLVFELNERGETVFESYKKLESEYTEYCKQNSLDRRTNKYNIKTDCYAESIFKNLEGTIPNIIKQIHNLRGLKRCILLIGGDDTLIKDVVGCIFYVHTKGKLFSVDCCGLNEEEIRKDVFEEVKSGYNYSGCGITLYYRGNTLFLKDIEGEIILKQLARLIRNYTDNECGMLIISLPSEENLPDVFLKQFEIIHLETKITSLEPENQKEAVKEIIYDKEFKSYYLPSDESNKIHIKPEQTNLLKYLTKRPKHALRIILKEVYQNFNVPVEGTISKDQRQKFDTDKNQINKAFIPLLGDIELIKNKGKLTYGLSMKIEFPQVVTKQKSKQ